MLEKKKKQTSFLISSCNVLNMFLILFLYFCIIFEYCDIEEEALSLWLYKDLRSLLSWLQPCD